MKKFEYFKLFVGNTNDGSIVYYDDNQYDASTLIDIMDDLGSEGWELVSVITFTDSYKPWLLEISMTYTGGIEYYFKRELSKKQIKQKQHIKSAIDNFNNLNNIDNIDNLIEEYTKQGYQITFQHPQRIIFNKGVEDVRFDFDKNTLTWIKHQ